MIDIFNLPYAYKRGNNPAGKLAYYSCSECGIQLFGDEVGYVSAGTNYANGEFSPCPLCGSENLVDRDEEEYE